MFPRRTLLKVVLYSCTATSALAQFTSGIQGVVTDPSGSAIPEALIHVTNVASGVAREAVTSNDGLYRVTNLGAGNYRVNVAVKGFGPAERPDVPLGISQTLRVDFALKIGDVVDQVTVTDQVTQVATEEGRISARIEPVKLNELPMNGRNLFSLLAFQPGVVGRGTSATYRANSGAQADSFSGETSPQTYANGQKREANVFSLDDSNTNSPYTGGSNLTPNADSVEEVRVVSNNFSATEGRSTGARVQMISKAGSNRFTEACRTTSRTIRSPPEPCLKPMGCRCFDATSSGTSWAGRSSGIGRSSSLRTRASGVRAPAPPSSLWKHPPSGTG